MVDLDTLAFAQEGHLMSNKKCELPEGSYRNTFKVRDLSIQELLRTLLLG